MTRSRMLALACGSLLAACGQDGSLQGARARYRLVAQIPATDGAEAAGIALSAHVNAHGTPSLVFAHSDEISLAAAAWRNTNADKAATTTDVRIVTIGGKPEARPGGGPDAVVLDETGAAVAIDVALLWSCGVTPPKQLPIGTRIFTPTNEVAGGTPRPAPGDFIVEMLRRQHATILSTTPGTDVVFRIGFVPWRADDAWHMRVQHEVSVAAKRYRQIDLAVRAADGRLPQQDAIIRNFLAEGCRAILVSTDDPDSLASVAAEASEHKVALIVLDRLLTGTHGTCSIGADQTVLGRAAGETVAQLLPNGGTIVELHGDLRSPLQQRRRQGFVDALGLK